MSIYIREIINHAVAEYGPETECLIPVVEQRYNRRLFPSTGQYDWFSTQVLYCLVRYVKPKSIIEVSTSSGYSALIQSLALRKNQKGIIYTFEIDPKLAANAGAVLRQFRVEDMAKIYVGDARIESERLKELPQPTILFLDSLHTEEFARWFIGRWVTAVPTDTLFQVHDVMPPTARVRFDKGPPWKGEAKEIISNWARRILGRPTREMLGFVKPAVFPPSCSNDLPTTNGVFLSEAAFINRMVQDMPCEAYAYLHDLTDGYPQLSPHRYDRFAIKREDRFGRPMEWNEAIWLLSGEVCKILQRSSHKFSHLKR